MKLAAVDMGTNSCRLLIAEMMGGRPVTVLKKVVTTRLGEGIQESGWLHPLAIKRTVDCLINFREIMTGYRVEAWRVVGTSALREAANREDCLAVAEDAGLRIQVISGEEEAYLSYLGVQHGLTLDRPPLVVDLGGGSTEFIYLNEPRLIRSVPVGAVKASEGDWPAVRICEAFREIFGLGARFRENPLVLVGGTPSTLVAVKKGLAEYDPELVHGQTLTREDVADLYNMLEAMPLELRRRLPGLQPERADIIVKGTLIVHLIMDGLQKREVTVSESDLLEGVIWQLAGEMVNT